LWRLTKIFFFAAFVTNCVQLSFHEEMPNCVLCAYFGWLFFLLFLGLVAVIAARSGLLTSDGAQAFGWICVMLVVLHLAGLGAVAIRMACNALLSRSRDTQQQQNSQQKTQRDKDGTARGECSSRCLLFVSFLCPLSCGIGAFLLFQTPLCDIRELSATDTLNLSLATQWFAAVEVSSQEANGDVARCSACSSSSWQTNFQSWDGTANTQEGTVFWTNGAAPFCDDTSTLLLLKTQNYDTEIPASLHIEFYSDGKKLCRLGVLVAGNGIFVQNFNAKGDLVCLKALGSRLTSDLTPLYEISTPVSSALVPAASVDITLLYDAAKDCRLAFRAAYLFCEK
jgi:hypothetical protein